MGTPTQPLRAQPKPRGQLRWREVATFIIALIVVVGFFAFIFVFWDSIAKDQQGIIIGVLLSAFTAAVGYYVASSIGSVAKSDELAKKKL